MVPRVVYIATDASRTRATDFTVPRTALRLLPNAHGTRDAISLEIAETLASFLNCIDDRTSACHASVAIWNTVPVIRSARLRMVDCKALTVAAGTLHKEFPGCKRALASIADHTGYGCPY